jgi:hypothetical protein
VHSLGRIATATSLRPPPAPSGTSGLRSADRPAALGAPDVPMAVVALGAIRRALDPARVGGPPHCGIATVVHAAVGEGSRACVRVGHCVRLLRVPRLRRIDVRCAIAVGPARVARIGHCGCAARVVAGPANPIHRGAGGLAVHRRPRQSPSARRTHPDRWLLTGDRVVRLHRPYITCHAASVMCSDGSDGRPSGRPVVTAALLVVLLVALALVAVQVARTEPRDR